MSYNKTIWEDRQVQYPNRFAKSGETSTEVTLTPSPGTVTKTGTPLSATNLNKMEQGIADAHALNVDNVTISDATAPTGDTAGPKTLFNWLANMIKQITGKANWRTAPRISLENAADKRGDTFTGKLFAFLGFIGDNLSDTLEIIEASGRTVTGGNTVKLITRLRRTAAGGPWTNVAVDLLRRTDVVDQAKITFHPDGNIYLNDQLALHSGNSLPVTQAEKDLWNAANRTVSGTWSDTSTSIGASGSVTKTIPLGVNAKRGYLWAIGNSRSNWVIVQFTDIANDAIGLSADVTAGSQPDMRLRSLEAAVTDGQFGADNIRIRDVNISGSNLIIVFENTSASAVTLSVRHLRWVVEY